ncbi:DUF1570 domain-containing protein [Roseimaritima sediminicola]|uniref:DUF1570 domain-containing protein n=1 Tax=Roseimaritima sediminicola TaxID=2662066 RepID=UPI0012982906|nr:DUF1570 domain-containing protein [Roseimaritima sediminicola]
MLRLPTVLTVLLCAPSAAATSPPVVEFAVSQQHERPERGLQLIRVPQRTVILGRDGWLHDTIDGVQPRVLGETEERFRVTSRAEMRSRLSEEYGRDFEVVSTTHYLVVQPRGRGDRWPRLFESLHRHFVHYMQIRGATVRQGRFPLVAVVLPDQAAMQAEFARLGIQVSRVAGVYHLPSNRVILHDQGHADYVAETVRHETAHQTAYNTGIHSRVNETPRWIVEGIGTLFEPEGMQSQAAGRAGRNRLSASHLERFRARYRDSESLATDLRQLIVDDSLFQDSRRIDDAYCLSWAMMFYLAERRPEAFARLLKHTAGRPPFRVYTPAQRLADFRQYVAADLGRFARNLDRFLDSQ